MNYDQYGLFTPEYFVPTPFPPSLADFIIENTTISEGLCVEINAGMGQLGISIADKRKNLDVILMEPSSELLNYAEDIRQKRQLRYVSTFQGTGDKLPFESGSINLVISADENCLAENPIQTLKETRRVLGHQGEAFLPLPGLHGFNITGKVPEIEMLAAEANLSHYEVLRQLKRTWLIIRKNSLLS